MPLTVFFVFFRRRRTAICVMVYLNPYDTILNNNDRFEVKQSRLGNKYIRTTMVDVKGNTITLVHGNNTADNVRFIDAAHV